MYNTYIHITLLNYLLKLTLLTYLLIYLFTYLLTYLHTYLHTYLIGLLAKGLFISTSGEIIFIVSMLT